MWSATPAIHLKMVNWFLYGAFVYAVFAVTESTVTALLVAVVGGIFVLFNTVLTFWLVTRVKDNGKSKSPREDPPRGTRFHSHRSRGIFDRELGGYRDEGDSE